MREGGGRGGEGGRRGGEFIICSEKLKSRKIVFLHNEGVPAFIWQIIACYAWANVIERLCHHSCPEPETIFFIIFLSEGIGNIGERHHQKDFNSIC